MKVLVYVEGPADRDALSALLWPLVESGRARGVGISFHPQHSKDALLDGVPRKAADHLADRPEDLVIALPDLYPMARYSGTRNAHSTFEELAALLQSRFVARANKLNLAEPARARFRVHCLKHDLEALLLAAPDELRQRLRTRDQLKNAWRKPVEDQNDHRPPKRLVEDLFKKYRKKPGYVETSDAPWILGRADLASIEAACPQRFRPFVQELRDVVG